MLEALALPTSSTVPHGNLTFWFKSNFANHNLEGAVGHKLDLGCEYTKFLVGCAHVSAKRQFVISI